MSSLCLKITACFTMLIDHITYMYVPYGTTGYLIGRGIGRIAFPLFCFMLVEGFYRTSSRKKYLLRLFIFALISELPFDFAFNGFPSMEAVWRSQNVIFTLFVGLLLLCVYDYLRFTYATQPLVFNTMGVIAIVAATALTVFLASDYSYIGILFILLFYLFRGKLIWIGIGMICVIMLFSNKLEYAALLALIPIFFYNQKEGRKVKYLIYLFYPVHLLLLGAISYMI